MKADWHITRDGGDVLHDDEAEHVALVLRTLRVDEATFRRVLAEYRRRCDDSSARLKALAACQCADLGLPEMSLRRYDSTPYCPTIDYDARARSLLVVGVHADRRLVAMRARERGLQVIFIDPEAYVGPDGQRIVYPVEAPQNEDLFVRLTAQEALNRLHRARSS